VEVLCDSQDEAEVINISSVENAIVVLTRRREHELVLMAAIWEL
jgi:hypothetical protein